MVGSKRNPTAADDLIRELSAMSLTGTLYLGYPIVASVDERLVVDGLLTCREHGVVVFDFSDLGGHLTPESLSRRQDDLFLALEQQLKKSRDLVDGRKLSVEIQPVSLVSERPEPRSVGECLVATPQDLAGVLRKCRSISEAQLRLVNAAVQRVTTIKPARKRLNIQRQASYGAKIREIEREIANLDRWQKSAAIETPEGPQRIRGLAGSGKTIVLALKAAYLHVRRPDWNICLTFWTRSLYQQFRDLVRRFTFEHSQDEPDWERLQVIHAWGSGGTPGVYSLLARQADVAVRDYLSAKTAFGRDSAFDGVCQELLTEISGAALEPLFDAFLIDEAQDLPASFFQLAYRATREPKRIVWAYDELQNLTSYSMPSLAELFGRDENGLARVEDLTNREGEAKRDLLLPRCYRNPPWSLVTAHALGLGIYRREGLVQFFSDPDLWDAIGYEVVSGRMQAGQQVSLRRKVNASPEYFSRLLKPLEVVQTRRFEHRVEQAAWVAEQIQKNLTEDELEARDILVIFPEARTFQREAAPLVSALQRLGIASHMAGVTTSRDELFVDNSIALSGIFRAKGNEAPMVYIVNSDYCFDGLELIKRRNTLFTAMTRSRGWVRVCGCGNAMSGLIQEIEAVGARDYKLEFRVPTEGELVRLRKIHRERPPAEQKRVARVQDSLEELLEMLEAGDLAPENLDQDLRERLAAHLQVPR